MGRNRRKAKKPKAMVDPGTFLCSLLCSLARLFQMLRKYFSMALCSNSSRRVAPAPALSWTRLSNPPVVVNKRSKESSDRRVHPSEDGVPGVQLPVPAMNGIKQANPVVQQQVSSLSKVDVHEEIIEQEKIERKEKLDRPVAQKLELDSLPTAAGVVESKLPKTRRRPARIVIPKPSVDSAFGAVDGEQDGVGKEMVLEGGDYCVASKRGQRHRMEDGYGVISNIHGDSKKALFAVFDGHGGRAAVDFVSEKLGKNIVTALDNLEEEENQTELAIKAGYLTTDKEFLSQGVSSGACAATALLKDGELHVANVGDCRVVMSRKGLASALTDDHRPSREDERDRIENSGGFVTSRNGIWRVQDSLAVSRAIGDLNMKEWIISEPETKKIQLTPDCEFLILASDGLWDKVTNQEAVDVVSKHSNSMKSCKELIETSCSRGNRDDITVMVIDLQKFVQSCG